MPKIFCTVTTDLSYDQRMIRICTSLAKAGYKTVLVGRKLRNSVPLQQQAFQQKRISCFFEKGKLFYAEYNIRLFFFLLFKKADCINAIDLDTILPRLFVSKIKRIKRVYDAHELFCEMKEIVTRPPVYKTWKRIEQYAVPQFPLGYTVNLPIAEEFRKMYGIQYEVIRNIAEKTVLTAVEKKEKYSLYQGAVNEGRSFETLIPAMKFVDHRLIVCGDGNFMNAAIQLVKENNLEEKVIFRGKIPPGELKRITQEAWIGITLFDDKGLSNYYSLANRFFDYMQAGIPQLCVDYPLYREINDQYDIALLTNDLDEQSLAAKLNSLFDDEILYRRLRENCTRAAKELNWENEEKKLLNFYKNIFE